MDIVRAFEIYQAGLAQAKKLEPRNEYRLYYCYNQQQIAVGPPWPTLDWQWIDITPEQAANFNRYKLVNGQLEMIDIVRTGSVKYTESATGSYTVAADHLAILVEPGEDYDAVKRVAPDPD